MTKEELIKARDDVDLAIEDLEKRIKNKDYSFFHGEFKNDLKLFKVIKQALDAQLSLLEAKQEKSASDVIKILQKGYKSAQNRIKHLKEKRAKSLLKIKELKHALDAEKKLVKACGAPKIEGLGEAIHDLELLFEDIPLTPYGYELYEPVLQAARAYHKQMGGE